MNHRVKALVISLEFFTVVLMILVWVKVFQTKPYVSMAVWLAVFMATCFTLSLFTLIHTTLLDGPPSRTRAGVNRCEKELPPRWIDYLFACFPPELRNEHIGNMTAHYKWCMERRKSGVYAKMMCTISVIGILVSLIPSKVMKAVIQHFIAPK